MFALLSRKKFPLVGIDISTTAVKLLELSVTMGKNGHPQYRVESYDVEPLPPNAVVEKNIAEVEAVGETIAKAVEKSETKAKWAAVAVSGTAAITKIITMPAVMTDAERQAQIQLEADQYIPYPLEEVNIDFQVLGKSERNPDLVDVLLAASRKENVEDRVTALELAGLKAAVVDVEAYAMESACTRLLDPFSGSSSEQTIAIADIGATTTTLNVLHNNKTIYTREQNFGGRQLTEEIQRCYGLSRDEAGLAKRQGGLPETYGQEVLEPFKEAMAQQISRSIQFFFAASPHTRIDHIVLAGGTSSIPGVDELVESRMNSIPTTIANPFTNMSVASRIKPLRLSSDAPAMMIAVGLALRAFD